jgi:hypothetical protein
MLGISSSAGVQHMQTPCSHVRHGSIYPSRFPIFTPDPVQGCSDKSEQRRSSAMRCPNLAFSPQPPYVVVGNELQRRIFFDYLDLMKFMTSCSSALLLYITSLDS